MGSQTSGERGIRSSRLSQVLGRSAFPAQVLIFKFLAHLRDLRVVYGYLALFGIVLSTVSAHRFDGFRPAAALPPKRESRRVYASRRDPEDRSAPERGEISASYSRFSSDLQRDESITGQQLKCRELAIPNGHYIAPELEFADYAISGTKRDRVGLDQVREAARQGAFKNIYFYNLARLARESVIAMPFLKELVHVYKIRIISVTEGLDSARQGWEMLATILCMQHERYIQDLSDSVLRGQETTVLARYSVGDFNFGYTSVPDPNGAVVGRGRNTKPRMIYAIDPTASVWVQRIFHWFAIEKRSLSSIVRELNRHAAPKDHRSTVPNWTQQHLLTLLKNPKYVGVWPWGGKRNVRNPLTGQLHQEDRPPEKTAKWTRSFPHLRLVTDELHEIACQRLAENAARYAPNRDKGGRLRGSKPGNSSGQPRHMLSGLIRCGHCRQDTRFYVGGADAKYLFCPEHRKGLCECQTTLQREFAEKLILRAVGERLLQNPAWLEAVFDETAKTYRQLCEGMPNEIHNKETALAGVQQKVANLIDEIESGTAPPDVQNRLRQRTAERDKLSRELATLSRQRDQSPPVPTRAWVQGELERLDEVLKQGGPAAALVLRKIVGGEIRVTEIRREGSQRHYLRGRFHMSASTVASALGNSGFDSGAVDSETQAVCDEIVIDFREPEIAERIADSAKELWDQGRKYIEIAKSLGWNRNLIQKAIAHWHHWRGLPIPDGRSHRKRLKKPRRAELILEQVMDLERKGYPYGMIAKQLGCDFSIVTEAVKLHHERQGRSAPDGRTRRKELRTG